MLLRHTNGTAPSGPSVDSPPAGAMQGEALERLARLRRLLPLLGDELARVRREAARLRLENRMLLERVRALESDLAGGELRRQARGAP